MRREVAVFAAAGRAVLRVDDGANGTPGRWMRGIAGSLKSVDSTI